MMPNTVGTACSSLRRMKRPTISGSALDPPLLGVPPRTGAERLRVESLERHLRRDERVACPQEGPRHVLVEHLVHLVDQRLPVRDRAVGPIPLGLDDAV